MASVDSDYILARHALAVDFHAEATRKAQEIETLWKGEWQSPLDAADVTHGPRQILSPGKPRSIVDKYLTMLAARSLHSLAVIPQEDSEAEQAACSKIERWMTGYQRRYTWETKRNPWKAALYWFFLRGRGCLETRFDAAYLGQDRLPLRTYADDPLTIFPIRGRDGIGYYTKEYQRYVWDVRAEIERHSKGRKAARWGNPIPDDLDEDDELTIVEYWDDTYCAAVLGTETGKSLPLYVREHKYGCVPLAEAYCLETPMASAEWAYQSVLQPIYSSLLYLFSLISKTLVGADMYYWPTMVVQFEDGTLRTFDLGTVRPTDAPLLSVKSINIVAPTPNAQVLAIPLGFLNGDISTSGIPDVAWGQEPTSLESGFAISQVLRQTLDKIWDKKDALEAMLAWDWGTKLKLLDKFGSATGASLRVPANAEGAASAY